MTRLLALSLAAALQASTVDESSRRPQGVGGLGIAAVVSGAFVLAGGVSMSHESASPHATALTVGGTALIAVGLDLIALSIFAWLWPHAFRSGLAWRDSP